MKQQLKDRIEQYFLLIIAIQKQIKEPTNAWGIGRKGFCGLIERLFDINAYRKDLFERHFPELWSLRPGFLLEDGDYWFSRQDDGMKKRVELVKRAIAIAQEKLNTFDSLKTN